MISATLLLILSVSARAQIAPAEPTPADMAHDISAQADKNPAGASASLNDLFRKLSTPGIALPTWKEVQQERMKRDLSIPSNDEPKPQEPYILGGPRTADYQIGQTRGAADVSFSRPLSRVELGLGASQTNVFLGNQQLSSDNAGYASVRINISRLAPKRKLIHSPTAIVDESDVTPSHVRVASHSYDIHSLP
jgi:hypothetical protein